MGEFQGEIHCWPKKKKKKRGPQKLFSLLQDHLDPLKSSMGWQDRSWTFWKAGACCIGTENSTAFDKKSIITTHHNSQLGWFYCFMIWTTSCDHWSHEFRCLPERPGGWKTSGPQFMSLELKSGCLMQQGNDLKRTSNSTSSSLN